MKKRRTGWFLGVACGWVGAVVSAGAQERTAMICGAHARQARAEILWTRVICKQPGRYIGWPSVCVRKNGEVLAVFSGDRDEHVCPFGKVQMVRSADQGETWSAATTVCNTPLDDRDAGIIEFPDGTLIVAWFTSLAYESSIRDRAALKPGSPLFYWWLHDEKVLPEVKKAWLGYFTCRSSDGGKTWEAPVRTPGSAPHGPIALKDGRLLYVGRTYAGTAGIDGLGVEELSVAESRDQGRTWQRISAIPLPEGERTEAFHEPHAVETADGRLVAQIRYHGKDGCLWQSESAGNGTTWSVARQTGLAGLPPHLLRLRDGKLVSVYGRRFDPYGEYACLSDDHGRTWDVAHEIKLAGAPGLGRLRPGGAGHRDGDLGYPASGELPDGSILTVYYQPEQEGEKPCLMATRWRVRE